MTTYFMASIVLRGSLVRKLPNYGRLSIASCLAIMATTSSWRSWDVWAIGNSWIHAWKHSRAQNHMFFSGKVAARGRRWKVSVSAVSRLDPGKWSTKCARDCSESSISHKISKKKLVVSDHFWKMRSTQCVRDSSDTEIENWHFQTTFGRWGRQSVHETVARAFFHKKMQKKLRTSGHFFKMRPTKCAWGCSESSISYKNSKNLRSFVEDEVDKMCTRL